MEQPSQQQQEFVSSANTNQNDILLDHSYQEYIKYQYNILISQQDDKETICNKIATYLYNGFKSRENDSEDISKLKLIKWEDQTTWPDYLIQDRPTKQQLERSNQPNLYKRYLPPHNASTLAWLLYLNMYPEPIQEIGINEIIQPQNAVISLKNTNEKPMDWQSMVERAVKDNELDPLDDIDNDTKIKNDDVVYPLNIENIDNSTEIQETSNTNDSEEDIITINELSPELIDISNTK